jgi:hypothetical protein
VSITRLAHVVRPTAAPRRPLTLLIASSPMRRSRIAYRASHTPFGTVALMLQFQGLRRMVRNWFALEGQGLGGLARCYAAWSCNMDLAPLWSANLNAILMRS